MMKTEFDAQVPSMSRLAQAAEAQRPFAFVAIGLAVLYLFGMSAWSSALPPSYWMRVGLVYVADAKVGEAPLMQEEIKINRPILARRVATVLKKQEDGRLARVCTSRLWVHYDVGYGPPDGMDLDWWTQPVKCELGPGEYIVQTSWFLRPSGHYPKELNVRSNEFKVTK